MTKILLCAALAYVIVAMAAILVGDGVLDARPRSTDTMIVSVPTEFVEGALEARSAHVGGAIEGETHNRKPGVIHITGSIFNCSSARVWCGVCAVRPEHLPMRSVACAHRPSRRVGNR